MIDLLRESPLLLLFVVAALGYVLGHLRIGGSSLGVAAVLFAGLAVGALDPDLKLPEFTTTLGLVLFVYTIGLSSGPSFFASLRRKGLRDNALVLGILVGAAGLTAAARYLLALKPTVAAGLFAGSLTNTPTLAGLVEYINRYAPPGLVEAMRDEPVVGYSLAYPMGVAGMIVALSILQRLWKVDYAREARDLRDVGNLPRNLVTRTALVTRPEATEASIRELCRDHGIVFGRVKHGDGTMTLAEELVRFAVGDRVTMVGEADRLDEVTALLGQPSEDRLELDRSEYDSRRIFVSDPRVVGRRLAALHLPQAYGAVVTRVRRGDVEWLAHDDTILELGDRVRVVTRADNMPAVSAFFGDSYRALSEINLLVFSVGLTLGLLAGMIPVPLPGGLVFRLGLAGGPLIAGLVLGKLGRTGPVVWTLPYSANILLRQLGLVLFFAGVGTRAGHAFFATLTGAGGLAIFTAGTVITCTTALLMLWVGYRLLGIPMSLLSGMLAGLQTQPAVLSYALEQSRNDLPNIGYATVYPVATIAKILLAQLLLTML